MSARRIRASDHVGVGFPPEEGKRLAAALLANPRFDWSSLRIDLTSLAPALLISSFFSSFLQEIYDQRKDLLKFARTARWIAKFPFQEDMIERWMEAFTPRAHVASIQDDAESRSRGGATRIAVCRCGWEGPQRSTLELVVDDALLHEQSSFTVSRKD